MATQKKGQLNTPFSAPLGKVPTQGSGPKGVYGGEDKGHATKRQTAKNPDLTKDGSIKVSGANPLASPFNVQFPMKK